MPPPLWYQIGGETRGKQAYAPWKSKWCKGKCWTKEACQSSLEKEGIAWEVDPPEVHESLASWLVILRKHLVHTHPSSYNARGTKNLYLSVSLSLMTCTKQVHELHELHGENCTRLFSPWSHGHSMNSGPTFCLGLAEDGRTFPCQKDEMVFVMGVHHPPRS